jgi:uncharacterized integral membrane protein
MTEQHPEAGGGQHAQAPRDTTEQAKLIGAAIAGLLLLLFFFQNMQQVDINFLWMEWHTRMIWSLIGSAVLGGGGVFFGMWFMGRRKTKSEH